MRISVFCVVTDYSIRPDELAREAEARGFDSLFVNEHTHFPADKLGKDGKPMKDPHYWHTYDPFVALTAAAAVTHRLRVGTAICLMIEHDPIITAKAVASLDHLSGGRVTLGFGGGWNKTEMLHHGTAYHTRWKLLRERSEAMRRIWSHDEASYDGEFVKFGPILSWPKPVQKPYPPIFVGGQGNKALEAAASWAEGWMPLQAWNPKMFEQIDQLRGMAERAGRDPASVRLVVAHAIADKANLEKLEKVGAEEAVFELPSASRDEVLRKLDELTSLLPAGVHGSPGTSRR
jgi:probable F420-dependent oxidoreductase